MRNKKICNCDYCKRTRKFNFIIKEIKGKYGIKKEYVDFINDIYGALISAEETALWYKNKVKT